MIDILIIIFIATWVSGAVIYLGTLDWYSRYQGIKRGLLISVPIAFIVTFIVDFCLKISSTPQIIFEHIALTLLFMMFLEIPSLVYWWSKGGTIDFFIILATSYQVILFPILASVFMHYLPSLTTLILSYSMGIVLGIFFAMSTIKEISPNGLIRSVLKPTAAFSVANFAGYVVLGTYLFMPYITAIIAILAFLLDFIMSKIGAKERQLY